MLDILTPDTTQDLNQGSSMANICTLSFDGGSKTFRGFFVNSIVRTYYFFPPYPIPRQKNDKLVGLALLARTISLWITLAY